MELNLKGERRCAVVFDSGIGGMNLLHACAIRVPDIDYYYVSDSENVPYGNREREEIYSLTVNALKAVEGLNPSALVIGCNTVTAACIKELREKYPFPVVGIQPAIKQAALCGGKCLVLATNTTVASAAFNSLLARYQNSEISAVGCGELAAFIEKNILSLPYTLPEGLLPEATVDCVVLGCTHYSFVKEQIKRKYKCPILDGTGATADRFAKILGIVDHQAPLLGIAEHFRFKRGNIVFVDNNKCNYKQIYKNLFKT